MMKKWFPDTTRVILCLVTLGPALENCVDKMAGTDQLTESVVLDAWGSAFMEGAVQVMDEIATRQALLQDLKRRKRRSPGYHPWQLESQTDLLDILQSHSIGVKLTDRFMMIPRKSVSFGVALY